MELLPRSHAYRRVLLQYSYGRVAQTSREGRMKHVGGLKHKEAEHTVMKVTPGLRVQITSLKTHQERKTKPSHAHIRGESTCFRLSEIYLHVFRLGMAQYFLNYTETVKHDNSIVFTLSSSGTSIGAYIAPFQEKIYINIGRCTQVGTAPSISPPKWVQVNAQRGAVHARPKPPRN